MAGDAIIGALRVVIGADTAALEKGLKDAQSIVSDFGTGLGKASDAIFNLKNALAALAGGVLLDFIKNTIQSGDEIAKTAQKIGITTDSLQELRYAAVSVGITTEDFDNSLQHLSKNLGDTSGTVTPFVTALGKLGLTMADMKGKLPDQALAIIADRIKGIADPTTKARIEVDLFNRSGQQMNNLLALGSIGLAALGVEAQKLGLVLSGDTLKKAEEANDEYNKIGLALKVAGVNIAVGFLPALEDLRKTVTSQDFQDGVKTLATNFGALITWIVDHKTEIVEAASAFAGFRIGAAFGSAFGPAGTVIGGVTGAIVGLGAASRNSSQDVDQLNKSIESWQAQSAALARQRDKTSDDNQIQSLTLQIDNLTGKIKAAEAQKEKLLAGSDPSAKITVNPASAAAPIPFDAATSAAIQELDFKTRILNQDFAALAPGFAEAAKALKQFGVEGKPAVDSVDQLTPQLQSLNAAMLAFKGAQLTQENLTPWQAYQQQLTQINLLQSSGVISLQTYQTALLKLKFPSLAQGIKDANDLNKSLDTFATSTINSFSSGIASIVTGQKTASEAFQAFGTSVLTMLTEMIVKMILFKALQVAIGFMGGGPVDPGSFEGAGLSASIDNPSMFAGGGMAGVGGSVIGPGTSTSDSILARLSNGEFVVNADSTRKFLPLLNAINFGDIPGLATGGEIGRQQSMVDADALGQSSMFGAAMPAIVNMNFGKRIVFHRDEVRDIARQLADLSNNGFKLNFH